jgi:hypothetical protein
MNVGKEFGKPVLLDARVFALEDEAINLLIDSKTVIVDRILSMEPKTYAMGAKKVYTEMLNNLQSRLNFLLLHPAYNNTEIRAITVEHPEYRAKWRQDDYDFLMSAECAKIIKEQDIIMITWRELRDKITRSK